MACVGDVVAAMETLAPPRLAVKGDPIGLHAGDRNSPVDRVAFALDASLDAIEAAAAWGADMLVVHHPRFYGGISTLAVGDTTGDRARAIVRSGLAVYSAHTNFDMAKNGTNDQLAVLAGITDAAPVTVEKHEALYKLAVFVPASHIDAVREAITRAGAGAIGRYSDCTFRSKGTGTFLGSAGTSPFLGKPGVLEEAEEYRLETVFEECERERVLRAMLAAHPYEEVAYDVYALVNGATRYGFGRVGELPEKETLGALAKRMARLTGSSMAQLLGKPSRAVRRIAVWAGAGVHAADFACCDAEAVVVGEAGYHELENFHDMGMGVIALGHGFSEGHAMAWLAKEVGRLVPGCRTRVLRRSGPAVKNIL